MQHYYNIYGIPLRSRLIAYLPRLNRFLYPLRGFMNLSFKTRITNVLIGFSMRRELPAFSNQSLAAWSKKSNLNKGSKGMVWLFNDEFTNYNESDIGIKAILLLNRLGYEVRIPKHIESGRTFLSKGLVKESKNIANKNVSMLKNKVSEDTPLIGIEPSAILAFRDEYPELVDDYLKKEANEIASNALLFEEFIVNEVEKGNIVSEQFCDNEKHILVHGHCQQKAVASTLPTLKMLALPKNYTTKEIPSGCCGMAGSFGYEKEHYQLSMKIGEMILFPAVREANDDCLIAAPGTSCRHHIKDGTGKNAWHPIEILYDALLKE